MDPGAEASLQLKPVASLFPSKCPSLLQSAPCRVSAFLRNVRYALDLASDSFLELGSDSLFVREGLADGIELRLQVSNTVVDPAHLLFIRVELFRHLFLSSCEVIHHAVQLSNASANILKVEWRRG